MAKLEFFKRKAAQNAVAAAEHNEQRRLKVNAAAVSAVVFTGSGNDDATSAGTFTGIRGIIYKVLIDAEGTPDTFEWFKDGVSQAAGVAITGAAQALDLGVTIEFVGTDNHTAGDFWEFEATITTDRHKISRTDIMALRLSLDQKVWYRWVASTSEPATNPITSSATADGDMVQSQILPAGNGITIRVPWGLIEKKPSQDADIYLFIQKHTTDALMQISEL